METFGIGVSHMYRSQDGQSFMTPENTQIHIQCVCAHEHTQRIHTVLIRHLLVPYLRQRVVRQVHKDALKTCNLIIYKLYK